MKNIKILKYGGAALSNLSAFDNMLSTLKYKQEYSNILLVVSAFSKTTKKLKNAAKIAESGDLGDAEAIISEIASEYKNYAEKLIYNETLRDGIIQRIEEAKVELFSLLRGISIVKELTARTLDLIMSYGEKLSLLIAFNFLKINGINVGYVDSSNIIITNSNYGRAHPILSDTEKKINEKLIPLFNQNKVVITQGFVASSADGIITTMGIESSNLTAAIYAKYLNCNEIIIFTDVNGIRTADPKVNANTKLIDKLSYKQAYLLGKCGLKLIFPKMIKLATHANIKVIIKSGIESTAEETIISDQANEQPIEVLINKGEARLLKVPFYGKEMHFSILDGKISVPHQLAKAVKKAISVAYNGKTDKAKFKVIAIEDTYILIELYGNANANFNHRINIDEITKCLKNTIVYFNGLEHSTDIAMSAFYRTSTKSIETLYHKL